MELEQKRINMLKQLKHSELTNKITSILILFFAVSVLFLQSCTKETTEEFSAMSLSDFTGTIWRLQSISSPDSSIQLPQRTLLDRNWLRFNSNGTLVGFGDSYTFIGTYTLSGNEIDMSFVLLDSIPYDQDIFCLYAHSTNIVATPEGRLTLSSPDGMEMTFIPVKNNVLKDRWRWVETRNGLEDMGSTPQTAGFEAMVEFGDSTFVFYKDQQEVASGDYRLQNTLISDCLGVRAEISRAISIDYEITCNINIATNALVTIPSPSILTYEITPDGRIILSLRENTCAGYLYIFEKM